MKRAMIVSIGAAVLWLHVTKLEAHALYSQPASIFSAGGGSSASANFTNFGVIAQPGVVGTSTSTSYTADHGFLPVLGGWKILYPVISATPGLLSFTLANDNADSLPLTISNSGGSTLKWSVAKGNSSETWFSVSPASGTGNASVTVTANAVGLTPGTYSDTLTISGTGISQTVQIQLALSVSSGNTVLRVTIATDASGKGGGSVHSDPTAIACSAGTCSGDFPSGSTVSLYQMPNSNSTWATWSYAGCGTSQECKVVMNGDQLVTATFPYVAMAKVNSTGTRYDTLLQAYTGAAATDTILARDVTFTENLTLNGGKAITFDGGLSTSYAPQNAWTTLHGILTLGTGSLTVDRLILQ
jgi:hypothetical protein